MLQRQWLRAAQPDIYGGLTFLNVSAAPLIVIAMQALYIVRDVALDKTSKTMDFL